MSDWSAFLAFLDSPELYSVKAGSRDGMAKGIVMLSIISDSTSLYSEKLSNLTLTVKIFADLLVFVEKIRKV
jgi:hypothetical protein